MGILIIEKPQIKAAFKEFFTDLIGKPNRGTSLSTRAISTQSMF